MQVYRGRTVPTVYHECVYVQITCPRRRGDGIFIFPEREKEGIMSDMPELWGIMKEIENEYNYPGT